MAQTRSPGYPSMPLHEALDVVKKLHDANRTNPVDREAAARDMGYTGLSGRSAKVLSDLAHFGLLEKAGSGAVRVTRRAVDILYPASDESRLDALHEAANSPSLFAELNAQFSDGPPSEHALRSYLMRNSFVTTAIPSILKSYLDTYRNLEQKNVSASHGQSDEVTEKSTEIANDTAAGDRNIRFHPVSQGRTEAVRSREIPLMDGERVVFVEEANAGQYLKLVATGELDDTLLEALEDFTKRLRKRLGIVRPKETSSVEAKAAPDSKESD